MILTKNIIYVTFISHITYIAYITNATPITYITHIIYLTYTIKLIFKAYKKLIKYVFIIFSFYVKLLTRYYQVQRMTSKINQKY